MHACVCVCVCACVQDPAVTQAATTAPAGVTEDYNPFTEEAKKEAKKEAEVGLFML